MHCEAPSDARAFACGWYLCRAMPPTEYDDTTDPVMGRLVEVQTKDGRWRAGVVGFCETTRDAERNEVSSGLYRLAWGRFASTSASGVAP